MTAKKLDELKAEVGKVSKDVEAAVKSVADKAEQAAAKAEAAVNEAKAEAKKTEQNVRRAVDDAVGAKNRPILYAIVLAGVGIIAALLLG